MRTWVTATWGAAALLLSVASLAVALIGSIETGVVMEEVGGRVLSVVPDQGAWKAGIRPGQVVEALRRANEPGGWALETVDADGHGHGVSAAGLEAPLRISTGAALVGVAVAVAALGLARRRQRRAELLAACSMLLAAIPYALADPSPVGSVVLLGASVGPPAWIARWQLRSRPMGIALVLVAVVLGIGVLAARSRVGLAAGPLVEAWAIAVAMVGLTAVGLGIGVSRTGMARLAGAVRLVDLAVVASASVAAVLLVATGVPGLVVVVGAGLALLAYGRARTGTLDLLDRVVLADVREGASIRAMEEERARVARELHDDPLQAIAGVIRALDEPVPDTAAAGESLRSVAARLRGVATELHPPVLDDLGLVPAMTAAVGDGQALVHHTELENETGYGRVGRPPADVELAVYRIVVEAVGNADRHSGGTTVTIRGRVGRDRIELEVIDDGAGLDSVAVERALRTGHLGLPSMRQRAAAIGAELELGPAPGGGTRVRLRWRQ
jgi:signal transduction histidine kinase